MREAREERRHLPRDLVREGPRPRRRAVGARLARREQRLLPVAGQPAVGARRRRGGRAGSASAPPRAPRVAAAAPPAMAASCSHGVGLAPPPAAVPTAAAPCSETMGLVTLPTSALRERAPESCRSCRRRRRRLPASPRACGLAGRRSRRASSSPASSSCVSRRPIVHSGSASTSARDVDAVNDGRRAELWPTPPCMLDVVCGFTPRKAQEKMVSKAEYAAWEADVVKAFYSSDKSPTELMPANGAPAKLSKEKIILVDASSTQYERLGTGRVAREARAAPHQHVKLFHAGLQRTMCGRARRRRRVQAPGVRR